MTRESGLAWIDFSLFPKVTWIQTCPNKDKQCPLFCFLVGLSVGIATRLPKMLPRHPFCFLFKGQWPYNWYYLLKLRQRDKEVKQKAKSRYHIYLYLWILRWQYPKTFVLFQLYCFIAQRKLSNLPCHCFWVCRIAPRYLIHVVNPITNRQVKNAMMNVCMIW